jgi:cytochrome c
MRKSVLLGAALLLPLVAGIPAVEAGEGAEAFKKRCSACHLIDQPNNRVGPHLMDVKGRTAGSIEGARYTDALKNSGIVWDAATLDQYLAAPRTLVPGSSMTFAVRDEAERKLIVDFLMNR